MADRGETLTGSQLEQCRPLRQGRYIRAFCPFHGSDSQRSLSVDSESGRFQCFSCLVWGYMDWARVSRSQTLRSFPAPVSAPAPPPPFYTPAQLDSLLTAWTSLLPDSPAADYLADRRIPLDLALRHRLGYAPPGQWPQRRAASLWPFGRLIVPHTTPAGHIINLYSRAVGHAPKSIRHDHLAGPKGYFGAADFPSSPSLHVCEGPLDALSLLAAGAPAAVAIFGVQGWRWDWDLAPEYIFAFDADPAGHRGLRQLARQVRLRGRRALFLSPDRLGGAKDVNEAWVAGTLDWKTTESN